jgi:gamma-glutamyltranspeptidase/glutathione hydrolase
MRMTTNELLDPERLRDLANRVDPKKATLVDSTKPARGGTVYLSTADASGMMVSYIQSNYTGFGSGIVIPGTGIALQNRGACFTLKPGHPNEVAPGKRPFHTIIPGFLSEGEKPLAGFGVMGGHMQPQGHVQMVLHLTLDGQNAQAALDAPRWQVVTGKQVLIESGFDAAVYEALRKMGHELEVLDRFHGGMGGGQFAMRQGNVHLGASDPRKDGGAVGY